MRKIEKNDLEFNWDLSESLGKCKIEVKYKLKKIKKDLTVLSEDNDNDNKYIQYKIDEDSDEDLDLDELTNKEEKQYKTNPELSDSDMDGLDDKYEIFTSKTDPNKKRFIR